MLIMNSQCQENDWVIQPPTIGPTVGASTAATPAMVVARPCERPGKSRKTAANTAGISVPPENPCTIRQAISAPNPLLRAQPSEASVNRLTAPTNRPRIPNRAVR